MNTEPERLVTIKNKEIIPMVTHYQREIDDKEMKIKVYIGGRVEALMRDKQSPPPADFSKLEPRHISFPSRDAAEKYVRAHPDSQVKEWKDAIEYFTKWRDRLLKQRNKPEVKVPADDFGSAVLTTDGFRRLTDPKVP
jgi:hypothetical protein